MIKKLIILKWKQNITGNFIKYKTHTYFVVPGCRNNCILTWSAQQHCYKKSRERPSLLLECSKVSALILWLSENIEEPLSMLLKKKYTIRNRERSTCFLRKNALEYPIPGSRLLAEQRWTKARWLAGSQNLELPTCHAEKFNSHKTTERVPQPF